MNTSHKQNEQTSSANTWSFLALGILALPIVGFALAPTTHAQITQSNLEKEIDFEYDDFHSDPHTKDEEELEIMFDDFMGEYEGILTEKDFETLSMKQIDEKLKAAGKETIGWEKDPLYAVTPAEMDAYTDAQWDVIDAQYEDLFKNMDLEDMPEDFFFDSEEELEIMFDDFMGEYEGILTEKDFETLSMKQIDEKLKAAGKETIGWEKDPLYAVTPAEMDAYTDAQWDAIDAQYEELFKNMDPEDMF